MISENHQNIILKIARNAIESLYYDNIPDVSIGNANILNEQRGVFVTLKKQGELRGCIGYIISEDPLYETLKETAKMAASQDTRFPKVAESELDQITIELSILSLPENISDYEEIVVGKHGLIVTEFSGSGVLLPQVAVNNNYSREEFLSAVCKKAGLPADLWEKRMLKIKIFTADIIEEKKDGC